MSDRKFAWFSGASVNAGHSYSLYRDENTGKEVVVTLVTSEEGPEGDVYYGWEDKVYQGEITDFTFVRTFEGSHYTEDPQSDSDNLLQIDNPDFKIDLSNIPDVTYENTAFSPPFPLPKL